MGNNWINPKLIAAKALPALEENMVITPNVDRTLEVDFNKAAHGSTMLIRKPDRVILNDGIEAIFQDTNEETDTVFIGYRKNYAKKIGADERALNEDAIISRFVEPAMIEMANAIELSICQEVAKKTSMYVGTAGTTPTTYAHIAAADLRMSLASMSKSNRLCVLDPTAHNAIVTGEKASPLLERGEKQLKDYSLSPMSKFTQILESNHIVSHTAGTANASYVTDGAGQVGKKLKVKTGAGTFTEGDVITVAGCYAVNPVTRQVTKTLLEQVVTSAEATGGSCTLNIEPGFVLTGPYQNVAALCADGAAIVVKATHVSNFAFRKNSGIHLVMVPIPPLSNGVKSEAVNYKGYKFLATYGSNLTHLRDEFRLDATWGIYIDKRELVKIAG